MNENSMIWRQLFERKRRSSSQRCVKLCSPVRLQRRKRKRMPRGQTRSLSRSNRRLPNNRSRESSGPRRKEQTTLTLMLQERICWEFFWRSGPTKSRPLKMENSKMSGSNSRTKAAPRSRLMVSMKLHRGVLERVLLTKLRLESLGKIVNKLWISRLRSSSNGCGALRSSLRWSRMSEYKKHLASSKFYYTFLNLFWN